LKIANFKLQTPHLASDGIIKLYNQEDVFQGIVLIQRLNEPKGIAIPGGFVDIGESVEQAVIREMKEEVTLDVSIEKLQGVYSKPNRDKRFHCVSCVFVCKAYGMPKAADDAKEVYIYKLEDIPFESLVFDHAEILRDFIKDFNTEK
jgi:8-oxo-dGTP diphosphatase